MPDQTITSRRLGVTPLLLRLAWNYALKGTATHYINHKHYDNDKVEVLYPWKSCGEDSQGGIRVSFRVKEKVARYVEFSCKVSGFGGDSLIKSVT